MFDVDDYLKCLSFSNLFGFTEPPSSHPEHFSKYITE